MITIKSIKLIRAEGPVGVAGTEIVVDSWNRASEVLNEWSQTAPGDNQGYHKCDVVVEWADDARITTRYDLVNWLVETPNLPGHIWSYVSFNTGKRRPAHLSPDEYAGALDNYGVDAEAQARWTEFYNTHDLGTIKQRVYPLAA